MNSRIYIGNLPFSTKTDELMAIFTRYGSIVDVEIVKHRLTGRPKGYAFISFLTSDQATAALACHGTEMKGRKMRVNFATQKPQAALNGAMLEEKA